ncbi:MAG: purine-nucleoside phosphorylase [Desulfomonile sp.]|nr:purine-nucleoside phosphorylase [Desulfomonile sp.]
MMDLYDRVVESVGFLRRADVPTPDVVIILGTGLTGVADRIDPLVRIPYEEVPHFPGATVTGHGDALVFGTLGGLTVVAMEGRFHYYEGYSLAEATLPVRVCRELGARYLIISSAAGGLNPQFQAGDVMIVTDHINLMAANPLRGQTDERLGVLFPDMSRPYDEELVHIAEEAATYLRIPVQHGVYIAVAGPSLETRAETRMLRMLGADAVGMSTVPEVIVAVQVGFRTLVLAAVTNVNLPDAMEPISVERVIANAGIAAPKIAAIMEETLRRLSRAGE